MPLQLKKNVLKWKDTNGNYQGTDVIFQEVAKPVVSKGTLTIPANGSVELTPSNYLAGGIAAFVSFISTSGLQFAVVLLIKLGTSYHMETIRSNNLNVSLNSSKKIIIFIPGSGASQSTVVRVSVAPIAT